MKPLPAGHAILNDDMTPLEALYLAARNAWDEMCTSPDFRVPMRSVDEFAAFSAALKRAGAEFRACGKCGKYQPARMFKEPDAPLDQRRCSRCDVREVMAEARTLSRSIDATPHANVDPRHPKDWQSWDDGRKAVRG